MCILRCRKIVGKDFGLRSSRLFILQIQLLYSSAVGLVGAEWHTSLLHGLLLSLCCRAQGRVAVWQGLRSAVMLLLFVHAAVGFPKAVPQGSPHAAGTSCAAHRWSLFWFLPHLAGMRRVGHAPSIARHIGTPPAFLPISQLHPQAMG